MIAIDRAIDTVRQLPTEQQEMLIDIFYRRHLEKRRKEIVADARKSIADFHTGRLKPDCSGNHIGVAQDIGWNG